MAFLEMSSFFQPRQEKPEDRDYTRQSQAVNTQQTQTMFHKQHIYYQKRCQIIYCETMH